jgi:hypothetical protein
MMDGSISRRGQPCWYRVPDVKGLGKVHNIAVNDGIMLEGAIYHLLKVYFRPETYYVDLLELFQEVCRSKPLPSSLSHHRTPGLLQNRDGSTRRLDHCPGR